MTDWRIKASIQKAISALPRSAEVNYVLQRRVAKTLPIPAKTLRGSVTRSREHLARYHEFGGGPLGEAVFYEFGSGWDLHLPIAFFAGGVNRQITVDIRRHARAREMYEVLRRIPEFLDEEERARLAAVSLPADADIGTLAAALGIEYRAPADARATGLPDGSVDCATSTSVLEHVPAEDLEKIVTECHRIVKPGGICSFIIDLGDHFSRFDKSIPSNNFLRYAPGRWSMFNPDVAYQNRLRYPDYCAIFDHSPFEVVYDYHRPSPFPALGRGEVHADFGHFSDEELAISYAHVVLRRPPAI